MRAALGLSLVSTLALSLFAIAPAGASSGCGTFSYSFEGTRLLNDGISTSAGPFDIDLPAGTYTVTLVAYDHHSTQPDIDSQLNEQFKVVLDSGYVSPPSNDIPDDSDTTTTVFTGQVIEASSTISVTHVQLPGINSVDPICVGFTPAPTPDVAVDTNDDAAPTESPTEPAEEPAPPTVEDGVEDELVEAEKIVDDEVEEVIDVEVEGIVETRDPAEPAEPAPLPAPEPIIQDIGDPVGIENPNLALDEDPAAPIAVAGPIVGTDTETQPVQVAAAQVAQDPAPADQAPQLAITGRSTSTIIGLALLLVAAGLLMSDQSRRLRTRT